MDAVEIALVDAISQQATLRVFGLWVSERVVVWIRRQRESVGSLGFSFIRREDIPEASSNSRTVEFGLVWFEGPKRELWTMESACEHFGCSQRV